MNSKTYKRFFHTARVKIILLLIYIISVNLLAGYLAVRLNFPSLWGNSQIFLDYAMPFGLTWALAHWPSIALFSVPLLLISDWNAKQIQRFRVICLSLFLILIYGIIEKIPFALFPAVDLFVAFFFSLIIVPPNYKENPKLITGLSIFLSLVLLTNAYYLYSIWLHRVPALKETSLMDGLFKLNKIEVDTNYKELIFITELTQQVSQEEVCDIATAMGKILFSAYQFDKTYKKMVQVIFNPEQSENTVIPYPLGELEQYKEKGETQIACYLKFK